MKIIVPARPDGKGFHHEQIRARLLSCPFHGGYSRTCCGTEPPINEGHELRRRAEPRFQPGFDRSEHGSVYL